MENTKRTRVGIGLSAVLLISSLGLSACSSGGSGSGSGSASSGSTKYTLWDPYPQFDANSAWAKLLDKCAAQQQVTITRQGLDTTALTSKLLLAAQARNAPDLAVIDNPLVSTVAATGLLASTQALGLNTSSIRPNILAAGQSQGKTYGVPLGSNTLALYYNKKLLAAAGVKPPTNWAQLTDAVARIKAGGHRGIAFSAVGTEEGSFQFLPFFWGAGADLAQLDSPAAVQALTLWTNFVKSGDASASVLNYTQADVNDQFLTGNLGFEVNGSWQLPLLDAGKVGYGIIPIPAVQGGNAPAPLGGEFLTVPVNRSKARMAVSAKLVSCITTPDNALEWAKGLSYVLPVSDPAVQKKEIAQTPNLAAFIDAVAAAKGRTSQLGTAYPKVSQQLWTAIQAALSGSKSPQKALTDAQAAVAKSS